jgi:preprotein translocase subunit SecE
MASKAIVNGEVRQPPTKRQDPALASRWIDSVRGVWNDFTRFLSDVRAEMRKVVVPSRKEVESTTAVVIVTVFIFGLFFFLVDAIFSFGMDRLLQRLGGLQ